MVVYQVLFKGLEKSKAFCDVFASKDQATDWAESMGARFGLQGMSSHSNEDGTIEDIRWEDEEGNSYYTVIFTKDV